MSLANDLRGNLAVCIDTSEALIALLSQRLIDMSEPSIGGKIWQFFTRKQAPQIDQDALVSMPDSLADLYLILSRQDSSYQTEKERIGSDIEAVEGLLRSQARPTRTRSLIKGTITSVLAGLIGTGAQMLLSGEASLIDLMSKMPPFSNLIVFSFLSGGIGITSWFLLRIRSRAQVKRIMTDERRLETLMKTGTRWLLDHGRVHPTPRMEHLKPREAG